MEVKTNQDSMSACNNCLDRDTWAETIIVIGGMNLKLCRECRKELMKSLIELY